jgi:hypothetical protein
MGGRGLRRVVWTGNIPDTAGEPLVRKSKAESRRKGGIGRPFSIRTKNLFS